MFLVYCLFDYFAAHYASAKLFVFVFFATDLSVSREKKQSDVNRFGFESYRFDARVRVFVSQQQENQNDRLLHAKT